MPKTRHVICRSHLVREGLETDVDLPADQAPVRTAEASLGVSGTRRHTAHGAFSPSAPCGALLHCSTETAKSSRAAGHDRVGESH